MLFVLSEDYAKEKDGVDVLNEDYAKKGRKMLFVLNEDYDKREGRCGRS